MESLLGVNGIFNLPKIRLVNKNYMIDRNCSGCTKCCEGHLAADIYGYKMYPGRPCNFVSKSGCSIYSVRPPDPCQGFKCVWKSDLKVPKEFKPDIIDMIMIYKSVEDIPYVYIVSADKDISLDVLDWAVKAVNAKEIPNIVYEKNGKFGIISHDTDFINKFNNKNAGVVRV